MKPGGTQKEVNHAVHNAADRSGRDIFVHTTASTFPARTKNLHHSILTMRYEQALLILWSSGSKPKQIMSNLLLSIFASITFLVVVLAEQHGGVAVAVYVLVPCEMIVVAVTFLLLHRNVLPSMFHQDFVFEFLQFAVATLVHRYNRLASQL
jgi:hypothetical protein